MDVSSRVGLIGMHVLRIEAGRITPVESDFSLVLMNLLSMW